MKRLGVSSFRFRLEVLERRGLLDDLAVERLPRRGARRDLGEDEPVLLVGEGFDGGADFPPDVRLEAFGAAGRW